MANEYQISNLSLEVLRNGTGNARVSSLAVEVIRSQAVSLAVDGQVASISGEVIRGGINIPQPTQVAALAVEVIRSIAVVPDAPIEIFPIRAERAKFVFPLSFEQTGVSQRIPEQNPYRPTLPPEIWEISETLGRFLREQSEILRQQHNKTQAGDSTFPWELLTQFGEIKQFTLGALGRFYHPALGIIHARYVQFGDWVATPIATTPCGYYRDAAKQDWVVTNDLSLSSSELALGVCFIQSPPTKDSFGWVVVQGGNPLPIQAQGIPTRPNQPYTWALDGVLQAGGLGTIFGSRRPQRNDPIVGVGEFFIDVGYLSDASIVALSSAALEDLSAALAALGIRVDGLELDVGNLQTDVSALTLNLTVLTNRIGAEEILRSNEIARLEALIGSSGVTSAELSSAIASVTALFTAADAGLSIRIDAAQARADAAFALAMSIDVVGIQSQIDALITGLISAQNRLTILESAPPPIGGAVIPVYTGDIPAVVVYDDDGGPIYTEL